MAIKTRTKKGVVVNDRLFGIRKLLAGVALIALTVVLIGSLRAGNSVWTMTIRIGWIMLICKVCSVVILKMLETYEERTRD